MSRCLLLHQQTSERTEKIVEILTAAETSVTTAPFMLLPSRETS